MGAKISGLVAVLKSRLADVGKLGKKNS